MSVFSFIASDYPLAEVDNPLVKQLSVNQALEMGIEVPDFLLVPSFDRNKPDVILWAVDENDLGELQITNMAKEFIWDDIYSEKKYFASLEWTYSESRAEKLIEYIQNHLKFAEEIELWEIWIGDWFDEPKPALKVLRISADDLAVSDIEKTFNKGSFEFPECMVVRRSDSVFARTL